MNFCFGDIVIVEEIYIGVVLKSWIKDNKEVTHEVYVRSFNEIKEYKESELKRYMVRHKELNEEEIEYQKNADNPFISKEEVQDFFSKLNLENL